MHRASHLHFWGSHAKLILILKNDAALYNIVLLNTYCELELPGGITDTWDPS